jgi:hypothetical protein
MTPGDRVAQLYPQALGTLLSRLLRYEWVTVVLLFNSSHHTGQETDVCHSIPDPLCFLGLSSWHILTRRSKAMVIKLLRAYTMLNRLVYASFKRILISLTCLFSISNPTRMLHRVFHLKRSCHVLCKWRNQSQCPVLPAALSVCCIWRTA